MVTTSPSRVILEANSVTRIFNEGQSKVVAVDDVSCAITAGEFVGLVGPSGCGKSTLLNIFGLVDIPSGGVLRIGGIATTECGEKRLEQLRRTEIGYVFQAFNLLSTLSVIENVMLPCLITGNSEEAARERATELLSELGMIHRSAMYPATLSGGEMQRVALARAIAHKPLVVVADEPTGNLDSVAGAAVLRILTEINQSGVTIVMATHSESAMQCCSRVLRMRDGRLLTD
jgi:putative ABC transport system ATP-binding protein